MIDRWGGAVARVGYPGRQAAPEHATGEGAPATAGERAPQPGGKPTGEAALPSTGESVARELADSVAGAVADVTVLPVLADAIGDATRSLSRARASLPLLVRSADGDLSDRLDELDTARRDLERLTLPVLIEVISRGLPGDEGLGVRDWVAVRCPWLSRPEINDLVTVAEDTTTPAHAPVHQALAQGELPLRRAARVIRALGRVAPAVDDPGVYAQDVEVLLGVATDPDYTDADLKKVTDKLIDVALPEKEAEDQARSARAMRGIHESSLADGTLTRFIITCDAEGAAFFRQVMNSPLAAPAPDADGPDPRTGTQRRYDALITILGRGIGAPHGTPGTAKAKLLLTVNWDLLTGMLTGSGHTLTGETLSPATARKLACTADLVPMILDKDGHTIETITPTRYATENQQLTLWKRDKHCTYPGCTIPAQWCDAHHITWWSRGGKTYLRNLALLCGRHHTLVHDKDLTATIDKTGVTWHV